MKIFGVDKNIILLGLVSFFTDISSEMIFSVFSVFFTVILGASTLLLGLIEGLADFSASSLDYVSGFLSDKTGKRKKYAGMGYAFSTLSKTLLLTANSVIFASLFRVVERLGKSFRGPPRDAWLSSLAEKENKGYSFAIHKTFDKSGAIIGPLIAYAILSFYGQTSSTFKFMFLIALIPAIIAVLILLLVKEKQEKPKKRENIFKAYKTLDKGFNQYLKTACIFSLAYFSFGFLLLKAYDVGFEIKDIVLLYALSNVSFVIFAVPVGKLGDKIGRFKIVCASYVLYLLISLGFILAQTKTLVAALFVLFGIFYSIDESQTKAYITDLEQRKKGTALGVYNFATGIVYLFASIIAGLLWKFNPNYTFIFGALIAMIALIYFVKSNKILKY